jgi:tetrahydromethanopterin S-methyltransferase subunit C
VNQQRLFFAIEVNVILWLIAGFQTEWATAVVIGLILSAVVQHWAYYTLVRREDAAA